MKAQQKHFIYVQSEDKQPFAVVLGGKVFSSSDDGYVIVPKLIDSTYKFTVSFPLNKFPDQFFTCTIDKKDAGYTLKNETDGWVLQNMQTQKIIANNSATVAQKNTFTNMLADVVDDSDLAKNTASQKPADTLKIMADTVANVQSMLDTIAVSKDAETAMQPQKIAETKVDTGTNMLFVDKTKNGVDTINVFVPSETTANTATSIQPSLSIDTTTSQNITPATPVNESVTTKDDVTETNTAENNSTEDTTGHTVSNPFYKPQQKADNTTTNVVQAATGETSAMQVSNAVKQDCGNMISDDDMNKLKRKMFVQKNDNEMIQYAVKYLSKKCITTSQVKLLGDLFSSDDGRYNLFDALYNYVYDYGNYSTLASQILDPYYKRRFAAMLR